MPDPVLLVPAYRPGEHLVRLVQQVRAARQDIDVLIVDDGSGPDFRAVFAAAAAAGAHIHHLQTNGGKGHALKAGFGLLLGLNRSVVTADADGQHSVTDILRVADAIEPAEGSSDRLVLGVREFDAAVPVRSRVGNDVTRFLFRLTTGYRVSDTQTGLRGFSSHLLPWLSRIPGERYEYELNVLLAATREDVELRSVPIETIYLQGNASSHFRPIADSARIYLPLLSFAASSVVAFTVDTALLMLLVMLGSSLLPAVAAARLASATINFAVNRRLVFDRHGDVPVTAAARRYVALAAVLLPGNYLLMAALTGLGLPILGAKVITESAVFVLSFAVQSRQVYRKRRRRLALAPHVPPRGQDGAAHPVES